MIKNILIVDDDKEDIELFCEAIKEIGVNIICDSVGNGMEAIKLLLSDGYKMPDCIFMDLNMPKMSGKQCLREIKKNDWIKNIEVVMYSTSKQEADMVECLELGAVRFFTKPTSFNVLKNELASFLK